MLVRERQFHLKQTGVSEQRMVKFDPFEASEVTLQIKKASGNLMEMIYLPQ